MKFVEFYFTEIKTEVIPDQSWIKSQDGYVESYLHINNTTHKVKMNAIKKLPNHTSFTLRLFMINNKIPNIYVFEFLDSEGRKHKTNLVGSMAKTLFGAIESAFESLVEWLPEDAAIIFSGNTSESGRTEIYDMFMKKIQKKYPFILSEDDFVQNDIKTGQGYSFYGFAKTKKMYNQLKGVGGLQSLVKSITKS